MPRLTYEAADTTQPSMYCSALSTVALLAWGFISAELLRLPVLILKGPQEVRLEK